MGHTVKPPRCTWLLLVLVLGTLAYVITMATIYLDWQVTVFSDRKCNNGYELPDCFLFDDESKRESDLLNNTNGKLLSNESGEDDYSIIVPTNYLHLNTSFKYVRIAQGLYETTIASDLAVMPAALPEGWKEVSCTVYSCSYGTYPWHLEPWTSRLLWLRKDNNHHDFIDINNDKVNSSTIQVSYYTGNDKEYDWSLSTDFNLQYFGIVMPICCAIAMVNVILTLAGPWAKRQSILMVALAINNVIICVLILSPTNDEKLGRTSIICDLGSLIVLRKLVWFTYEGLFVTILTALVCLLLAIILLIASWCLSCGRREQKGEDAWPKSENTTMRSYLYPEENSVIY